MGAGLSGRLMSLARPGERIGHTQRALMAGTAGTVLLVAVATVAHLPPAVAALTTLMAFVGASSLCWIRVGRLITRRGPWIALGVALGAYAAGNVTAAMLILVGTEQEVPSFADLGWLAFFPFAYLGLVLLLQSMVTRFALSMLLDGLVAALGVTALAWTFAFDHLIELSGDSPLVVLTNLAYPVADLLLIAVVVGGVSALGLRFSRTWGLLAFGLLAFALADTLFALSFAGGTYDLAGPVTVLWPLAALSMGLAAVYATDTEPLEGDTTWWRLVLLPGLFSLGSLLLLAYSQVTVVPIAAAFLAVGALVAAAARAALMVRDVSTLAETRRQARTDELTGLHNRRAFGVALDDVLHKGRPDELVTVLLIDLDRFKEINDSLGHPVGDELLRLIGPRLSWCLRADDMLARVGGDEFAILVTDCDSEAAVALARRIMAALDAPFALSGISLHVRASMGIAISPIHTASMTVLFKQADVAMYDAKANGGGFRLYDRTRDLNSRSRLQTNEWLRAALVHDELDVYYQPLVELSTDTVVGVEALVRWVHPELGLLAPDDFLPMAEQGGLMRLLTRRVLEHALAQIRDWRARGRDLAVSVNVSASNLLDAELPSFVSSALHRYGLPPSALEIEITESHIMADPGRAQQVLSRLRSLGVRVAVDDYGTGHSSLAYLRDLAVNTLKLDKSFVQEITRDSKALKIVRSTAELAHALDLVIVAEGVEEPAVVTLLAQMGCDFAQGYLYSRPVPAPAFESWLLSREVPHAKASSVALSGSLQRAVRDLPAPDRS